MNRNLKNHSDDELVLLFQNGDNEAFGVLYQRYSGKLKEFISFSFPDTAKKGLAEDLVHDTFTKGMEALKERKYTGFNQFKTWLFCIGRNLCIDHYRALKRSVKTSYHCEFTDDLLSVLSNHDDLADEKMIQKEKIEIVKKLVKGLESKQQEIVILRMYTKLPFKQIAYIQDNISINTALGRMRYGIINLNKTIAVKGLAKDLLRA